MRMNPMPARTSNSAATLPRAPAPTNVIRAAEIRRCPSRPMGANRTWREYRSSLCKRFQLLPHSPVDRINQRLHIDRHGLRDRLLEFRRVLWQDKEWSEARFLQEGVSKQDRNRQVAEFERPDIHDSGNGQRAGFDGMNLAEAFRGQPGCHVVERSFDKFRGSAVLTPIQRRQVRGTELA